MDIDLALLTFEELRHLAKQHPIDGAESKSRVDLVVSLRQAGVGVTPIKANEVSTSSSLKSLNELVCVVIELREQLEQAKHDNAIVSSLRDEVSSLKLEVLELRNFTTGALSQTANDTHNRRTSANEVTVEPSLYETDTSITTAPQSQHTRKQSYAATARPSTCTQPQCTHTADTRSPNAHVAPYSTMDPYAHPTRKVMGAPDQQQTMPTRPNPQLDSDWQQQETRRERRARTQQERDRQGPLSHGASTPAEIGEDPKSTEPALRRTITSSYKKPRPLHQGSRSSVASSPSNMQLYMWEGLILAATQMELYIGAGIGTLRSYHATFQNPNTLAPLLHMC